MLQKIRKVTAWQELLSAEGMKESEGVLGPCSHSENFQYFGAKCIIPVHFTEMAGNYQTDREIQKTENKTKCHQDSGKFGQLGISDVSRL